ncbi:polyprenyl synthetase family protein [Anaerococcus sp. WCA-380-WT-2B]|uniref:Polyprenyl synthetase family protein n=2 Tax=Anaerococcus porci TaxID=2652269 RepID=A0A6N7VC40_9FIRM|nr:polyprenyl synthetase family protein [Anaerococcus porci]
MVMMNKEDFKTILKKDKKIIDRAFEEKFKDDNPLNEALRYATDSGKRIRPILFLESYKMLTKKSYLNDEIIEMALNIEMIHAYSLVHDDLPSMDNDDLRRGKPTVHKKFGEDIAILIGDSLLNLAFENSLNLAKNGQRFLDASLYLSKASGIDGMIKGQVYDLRRNLEIDLSYILEVYKNKTSRLFMAACVMAGLLNGLSEDKLKALENYAYYLGLSFQIQDDLLDKNEKNELNILSCKSLDEANSLLLDFNNKAKENINKFKNNDFHIYLIDYLTERTK